MRSTIRFCVIGLVVMAANIYSQTDMTNELRSTFQNLQDKWNKALVAGDLNTLVNFYLDDAISLPSYMPMMRGKEEIREGNKKDLEQTKYLSLNSSTTDVFGSGDLAIEIGTYDISLVPAKMTQPIKDHGKYITIWQKQPDGSWKIKADTFNTDTSPMGQTQAGAKEKMMDKYKDSDKDKEYDKENDK